MKIQTTKPARMKKAIAVSLALLLVLSYTGIAGGFGAVGVAEATGVSAGGASASDSSAVGSRTAALQSADALADGASALGGSADSSDAGGSSESASQSPENAEQPSIGAGSGSGQPEGGQSEGAQPEGGQPGESAPGTGLSEGEAGSTEEGTLGSEEASGQTEGPDASGEEALAPLATEDEPAEAEALSALDVGTLTELRNALRDAADGDVVNLTSDITVTNQVNLSMTTPKNVTIDGTNPAGENFSIIRGGSYAGYLIRIDNGNGLTFRNVTLDGANIASGRAHVYMTAGSLVLGSGSVFQNSTAIGSGGAIAAVGGSVTVESGAVVQNNTAANNGGGINVSGGSLSLEPGSLIQNNHAGGDGGGVNLYASTSGASVSFAMASGASITGNSAVNGGGAVVRLMSADDAVSVAGLISGNRASNNGGGLYINPRNASNPPVVLAGTTLSGNTAGGGGGGLYVADSNPTSSLTLNDVSITGNSAASGAGMHLYHRDAAVSHTLTVNGGTISNNSATTLGGGAYLAGEGTLNVTISRAAVKQNHADGQGGGIWVIGRGSAATQTVTLGEGTVLSGNSADVAGGLYFRAAGGASAFSAAGATVEGNSAVTAAGGLRLQGIDAAPMQARIENSSVSSNEQTGASDSGGAGIGLYSAELVLGDDAAVSSNTAAMRGGGVFSSKSSITMKPGSEVDGNEAGHNGGGFFLSGAGSLTEEGGASIAGNRAANGGGVFASGATVDLAGAVTGNTASSRGGGVHVANEGRLEVREGATVDGNAASHGGGIALTSFSEGSIAGSVSDNNADHSGGGVFYGWPWSSTATPAVTNLELADTAVIAGNTAADGAGLYAAGAGNGGVTDVRVSMDGAELTGNTASGRGGGFYVEKATLDVDSGTVSGNASGENLGHDLWVDPALPAGSTPEGGVANLRVSEASFSDDADRDKVVIGAGTSGTVNFLHDFEMRNHLLLQNDGSDLSRAYVESGTTLTLSGKLTVGIADKATSHSLEVDPNGGSVRYKNDAEAAGADAVTGAPIADMYAFPGASTSVYLQWPDQGSHRAGEPFKGWSDDGNALANHGVEYLHVTDDSSATALWGSYTIRYFDDDGTTELSALEPSGYAFGTETTALPEPTKEGHRFVAWYEDAEHSGSPVTSFDNADREDKAFFAKWEASPTPPTPPDPGPGPDPTPDPDPDPSTEPDPSPLPTPGSEAGTGANANASRLPGASGLAVTGDALIGLGVLGIVVALAGTIVFVARRKGE